MTSILAAPDARFDAALAAVEAAEDIGALRTALIGLLQPYGLRHAVYHAVRIPNVNIEQEVIAFTYPKDWVSHYLSKKYFNIDPVVHMGGSTLLPVNWDDIVKTDPVVRRLFAEAEEALRNPLICEPPVLREGLGVYRSRFDFELIAAE